MCRDNDGYRIEKKLYISHTTHFIIILKSVSLTPASGSDNRLIRSGMMLYTALPWGGGGRNKSNISRERDGGPPSVEGKWEGRVGGGRRNSTMLASARGS